jgi:hypothetical protein
VHDTEELESTQNIKPKGYNNSNNAINPNHHFNYCRKYRPHKISNKVSHAEQYIRVSL